MKKLLLVLLLSLFMVAPAQSEDKGDNFSIKMKENFQSYPIELRKLVVVTINSYEKTLASPKLMVESQLTEAKSKVDEIIISYPEYSGTEFISNFKVLHHCISTHILMTEIFKNGTSENKVQLAKSYAPIENIIKQMKDAAGLW